MMTTTAGQPAGQDLVPARPLAAQAHALRAAAVLLEQAGIAGLSVTISRREILIQVPERLGSLPARAAVVARLADLAGGQAEVETRPGQTFGWVHADGHAAGHEVHIFTPIAGTP
jgi:hypothetical protein